MDTQPDGVPADTTDTTAPAEVPVVTAPEPVSVFAPTLTTEPVPAPEPISEPATEPTPLAPVGPSADEVAALRAELAANRDAIESAKADARSSLADRLGVLPNFREYLPDADPFTVEGKAALQAWADAHPEALRSVQRVERPSVDTLTARLKNAPGAWLVNPAMLERMRGGR